MPASRTGRRALRFRMEPTPEQHQNLLRFAGARRWAWNWALAERRQHYAKTGKSLLVTDLCTRLTAFKNTEQGTWLKQIDSQLPQQAFRDLDNAFLAFFEKRSGFPKFKSRKRNRASFRIPQRVQIKNGQVYIPRIGWVRMRQSRDVLGELGSITCAQAPDGHWFASIVETITLGALAAHAPSRERLLGLDRGLKDLVVSHEGWRVPAPRFFRQSERKLRQANKALARTQQGSKGREHTRRRLARVHTRTCNLRNDYLHQLTSALARWYDGFCLETLSLKGMARTKLAKSVADAALGQLARQLRYKADWQSKPVVQIDRWFPSSKTCSACGYVLDELPLTVRVWTCLECGTEHDRDVNAAINIRREGLRRLGLPVPNSAVAEGHPDTRNGRGAAVRPATRGRAA
jgi:putative transposase